MKIGENLLKLLKHQPIEWRFSWPVFLFVLTISYTAFYLASIAEIAGNDTKISRILPYISFVPCLLLATAMAWLAF